MSDLTQDAVFQLARQFSAPGEPVSLEAWHGGHINTSFRIGFSNGNETRRYLLQRINSSVFPEPAKIMDNIRRVTLQVMGMLQAEGVNHLERRFLALVPAHQGGFSVAGPEGDLWRMYPWIEGTFALQTVETPEQAEAAGWAFGDFLRLVSEINDPPLHEIIADFHHTPKRLVALQDAVQENPLGRAKEAADTIALAESLQDDACLLQNLLDQGGLPLRPVHNDTKISNVLFDEQSGEALCVVDLDTLMPGSALHDFGDMARSMSTLTPEDGIGPDGERIRAHVEAELFAAVCKGFLSGAGNSLSQTEKDHLVLATQTLATELGARFLTDYLLGDPYFGIQHTGQNLDRARVQLGIADQFRLRREEFEEICKNLQKEASQSCKTGLSSKQC